MKNVVYYDDNVIEVILKNEYLEVHLLNVGASMFKLFYDGVDVLVGPKDIKTFIRKEHYYGKTVGRFSGRLPLSFNKKGLNINLKPYKGDTSTIHGGENGFSTRKFSYVETKDNEVLFTLIQKEEDDGLPGDISLEVKYELTNNELKVSYLANTTKTTILNIINHGYFNLDQSKTILEHELQISADKYVVFDDEYNIKGIKEVDNTIYDFKDYVEIKKPLSHLKGTAFKGLDTIFKLNKEKESNLYSSKNKTNMQITTNYPSLVVYTHNADSPDGLDYYKLWPYAGVALECEYEPGGIMTDFLNDGILKKKTHIITLLSMRSLKKKKVNRP